MHLHLSQILPAHTPATLLPLLSLLNDIEFRTSVPVHTTSKGSTTLTTPGHGPLPTRWAMFFILPVLLWSSIHLLSSLLLPGSSIVKWTSHSSRNIGIHFQSSVGAENPLPLKYVTSSYLLHAGYHITSSTDCSSTLSSALGRFRLSRRKTEGAAAPTLDLWSFPSFA